MGLIWTLLGWSSDTGRADDPDPVTGLSSRDRYYIRTTWDVAMKDATETGIVLFLRLFEIEPKHHQQFPFRDIPIKDLRQNKTFHAHCNIVVYSLASIVSAIEDPVLLKNVTEKIAINHAKRGVNEQALEDVKNAFLDTLSPLTLEQHTAWSKLLDFGFGHMVGVIKEINCK